MDANVIMTMVSSVGFPIVACLGLAWYVKYTTDTNNKTVDDLRKDHAAEVQKMTEALNNNTLALQRLVDKLDKGDL